MKSPRPHVVENLNRYTAFITLTTRYLKDEALDKKMIVVTKDAAVIYPKIPSQHNLTDCGVYLLFFVMFFMRDPDAHLHRIFVHSLITI